MNAIDTLTIDEKINRYLDLRAKCAAFMKRAEAAIKPWEEEMEAIQERLSILAVKQAELEANQDYIRMQQDRRFDAILDNAKAAGITGAKLAQLESELARRWPIILESQTKLGKLEPLINDMGSTTTEAAWFHQSS